MSMTGVLNIANMMEEEADQVTNAIDLTVPHEGDGGANIAEPFFYLAGPMSNLPKFNFPEFTRAASALREKDMNICNPAEFEHEISRAVMGNETGSHKKLSAFLAEQGIAAPTWADCLRRDIVYVGHPNCTGVICMDGWEHSQGAQFETYVAYKLLKPVYKLDWLIGGGFVIHQIERRVALEAAGVVDG